MTGRRTAGAAAGPSDPAPARRRAGLARVGASPVTVRAALARVGASPVTVRAALARFGASPVTVWAALARVGAVPAIWAGERLVVHPNQSAWFDPLLGIAAVYAAAVLVLALRGRAPRASRLAAVDFALLCALTYVSGGPYSQLRFAFFLAPVVAAAALPPRPTARVGAASVAAYAAISLLHPASERAGAVDFELGQLVYLGWMGVAATLLSAELTRRSRRVSELADARGRLVAQALDAEDRARRRLAEALHDEAIQNLLAARQELAAGERADRELVSLGLDRTVAQLRDAVFDLHPYLLEHAGLEAAIRAVAERHARHAGFATRVRVAPEATGPRDQLVFSLARELLVNAAKHADATHVSVDLSRRDGRLCLTVVDDGAGLDPVAAAAAPQAGHIGLASARERVEAVGGSFAVTSAPGAGTSIRVALPAGA
jgi:two-component system NarL family sensor kinase